MAPTTRSAGKRAADPSIPPGPFASTETPSRRKARKNTRTPVEIVPGRCMLLEMPPEIRNRIYHYCRERTFSSVTASIDFKLAPCAIRRHGKATKVPEHAKARTFLSLTQACKLFRAEFRPVWLKSSSVSIDFIDIDEFISTFYPQRGDRVAWYCNSPQLLVILWDHDKSEAEDDDLLLNLKPLLKLRSWSRSSTIMFAGRSLVEEDTFHARCYFCQHCVRGKCGKVRDPAARPGDYVCEDPNCVDYLDGCDGFHDSHSDSDIDCDHEDVVYEEHKRRVESYEYLRAVNNFLDNSNVSWLHLIREDFMHLLFIQCTIGTTTTIYFHFARNNLSYVLNTKDMYWSCCKFLTQMGIMDLPMRKELDFVVGLPTGKQTRTFEKAPAVRSLYQTLISGSTQRPYTPQEVSGFQRSKRAGPEWWRV